MIRVALIGAGRWGGNILNTLKKIPGCEVVAVATTGRQTEALQKLELDAVVVATPGSTHTKVALPFLRNGLPVFIEKPMALTIRDAERLKQVAEKNNVHIFVGHIHLYNPAYKTLKRELKKIGQINSIVGESMSGGPIRDDMSVLWDWGPHDVSMVLDIVGSLPNKVKAIGDDLQTHAKLTFSGTKKITAYLTTSWLSAEKRKRLTVIGTKGTLVFDDYAAKKVTLLRGGKATYPRYGNQSPLEAELRTFLRSIKEKSAPISDAQNGLDVVRVLAAVESARR